MHASILKKVIFFSEQQALFSQDARLLVAVSGGGDSIALLSMLVRLRARGLVKDLVCVHFNHQLREQALQDQAFVQNLADAWAVPLICETRHIRTHARTSRCSVETAGRQWRLKRLVSLAQAHQCTEIATGHHLNDSAETLIHRLSRGTGLRGMCGIRPIRIHQGMRVVSPLLTLTRQDILAYLASQQQGWCEDATNQDRTYTRNYIRHAILPELSKQAPRLTKQLGDLALRCHDLYLSRIEPRVRALLQSHVHFSANAATVLLQEFPHVSDLVLVEFFRSILTDLHIPLRAVTRRHYQTLIALIQRRTSHVILPGKASAVRVDPGTIRFLRNANTPPPLKPVELAVPGTTHFGDRCFLARIVDVSQISPQHRNNPCVETLDLQRVTLPLQLRSRIPGDRFVPLGRTHAQRIGKFLNRAHIKDGNRNHTVILCDSKKTILWVCPVRMSELARITDKTKDVLEVSVRTDPKTADRFQTEDEYQ